jgi:hypothetical protein
MNSAPPIGVIKAIILKSKSINELIARRYMEKENKTTPDTTK